MKTFKIKLSDHVLHAQIAWLILANTYNAISWWRVSHEQSSLAPTNPSLAFFVVLTVAVPTIAAGFTRKMLVYSIFNAVFLFITANASYTHTTAYLLDRVGAYASPTAWAIALAINLLGLAASLVAATYLCCQYLAKK